jgi:hypothetical protein
MTLRNTEYRITFRSVRDRLYYCFSKDQNGWFQITASGNRHSATAEQVLNHMLPVLAKVKSGVKIDVEYVPANGAGESSSAGHAPGETSPDTLVTPVPDPSGQVT